MMYKVIATALAVLAGLAVADPAFAGERKSKSVQNHCPDMPTTNDVDRAREGGASLHVAGFGISGNKSRAQSTKDVMMREGGIESWSAAMLLVKACHDLQRQYPHDLQRQRQELLNLRNRLLSPEETKLFDPDPVTIIDISTPIGKPATTEFATAFDPNSGTPAVNTAHQGEEVIRPDAADKPKRSYASPIITTVMCGGNGCIQTNQQTSTRTCTVSQPMPLQSLPMQIGNMTISSMPITIGGSQASCTTTFGF